jgi:hypothetical protein
MQNVSFFASRRGTVRLFCEAIWAIRLSAASVTAPCRNPSTGMKQSCFRGKILKMKTGPKTYVQISWNYPFMYFGGENTGYNLGFSRNNDFYDFLDFQYLKTNFGLAKNSKIKI